MVLCNDLNDMNLSPEDMVPRTPENMQDVITKGQDKEFSVHSTENVFWKFP